MNDDEYVRINDIRQIVFDAMEERSHYKSMNRKNARPAKGGGIKPSGEYQTGYSKNIFSKLVMAAVMMAFFVGVGLGVYEVVINKLPTNVTLDYIKFIALPVSMGYFVKAFGENIAKIVLPHFRGGSDDDGGI